MNQPQHRDRPAKSSRRTLLLGLSAAIALPLLQGCFPVVATGVGAGAAMVGHSDRMGLDDSVPARSWNSSHQSRGCSMDALKATGGAGLLYCFAVN